MAKYALFYGQEYEPNGGWHDLAAVADNIQEAQGKFAELNPDDYDAHWAHIVVLDDNPRIVSWRKNKEHFQAGWHRIAAGWYDEGSECFEYFADPLVRDYPFSNLEPFTEVEIAQWQEQHARQLDHQRETK